jgi:trk system potassium uptake protein TrkA
MILIIGAGDVGSSIATDLAGTHDVTIIDTDQHKIETLTADLDVDGIVGDGRSLSVLTEAVIEQAEIVVASTDSDAANVMACKAAKRFGDPHTLARVKDVGLYRTWQSMDSGFGVDNMFCIDVLAAESIARTVAVPGAKEVDTFVDGKVEVAEFEIGADSPVTDQTVADADRYPSVTFASILRDGDVLIPDGDTVIESGDYLVVIGDRYGVSRFAKDLSTSPGLDTDDNIVIAGGDTLGYQIARQFELRGWSPQIVERDADRVARLKTQSGGITIGEGDVTAVTGFNSDFLRDADLLVGAVDDDTNYLLTQLATERGIERTAAVVDNRDLIDLFEDGDIDVVVHPEDIIAGEILETVYGDTPLDISLLEHDRAEVLEVIVESDSILAGQPLRDAASHLPDGVVIGATIRNGELQNPRGNMYIETGDRVIAFADNDVVEDVLDLI